MSHASTVSLGTIHNFIARLSPLRANVLAFVCGVITLFAFAPFHFWLVLPVAITLLIWMLDGARLKANWRRSVFLRGWLFGAGFTLASMHWTAAPFLVEPEKHLIFIWMPLILLPAGLGLFFGAATFAAGHLWSRNPGRIFVFVVCISITEYLRGVVFGGFPWNWAGTTWEPGSPISQIAAISGVFGLTVLTFFLSAVPAALADFRPVGQAFVRILPGFICVVLFGLGWGWGTQRLNQPPADEVIAARLVDIAVPMKEKYPAGGVNVRNEAATKVLRAYLEAMGDDFLDEPRLVIWPEGAIPFRFSQNQRALPIIIDPNALDAISSRLGERTLITGTVRVDRYDNLQEETWYNSLAVLTKNSARRGALGIYDKRKLVPFGELAPAEFIPFGHAISGILPSAMQQAATQGYTPGERLLPSGYLLELPSGEKVLPLICYEALFSDFVRKDAAGADLLVNISIDSWFGGQIGPKQHFVNAAYRSIETGLPLLRVANQGVTAAVDPWGRIVPSTQINTVKDDWAVTVEDVTVNKTKLITTYSRVGQVFSFLFLAGFISIALIFFKRTDLTG